jgi:hypothetical protein
MHLAYVWKWSLLRICQFHWIKVLQLQSYAPLFMTLQQQQQKGCLRCVVRKVYFELPPACECADWTMASQLTPTTVS